MSCQANMLLTMPVRYCKLNNGSHEQSFSKIFRHSFSMVCYVFLRNDHRCVIYQCVTCGKTYPSGRDQNRHRRKQAYKDKATRRIDLRGGHTHCPLRIASHADAMYGQVYKDVQPGVVIGNQSAPTAERSFYTYSLAIQQLLYDFGGVSSYYEASKRILETNSLTPNG